MDIDMYPTGDTNKVHRFLTLDQIEQLRDAAHSREQRYDSSLRDEILVVLMADLGLRVNELVSLKTSMVHLDQEEVMLPGRIQKDYPLENVSPSSAMLRIDPEGHFSTIRMLRTYLRSDYYDKYGDGEYLLPSRQSSQMTTESVRNVVRDLAIHAGVCPQRTDGEPSEPDELHPHVLRHSVANYMLANQDNRLIDVRNRLRHRSIQTTERVYEHFQRR